MSDTDAHTHDGSPTDRRPPPAPAGPLPPPVQVAPLSPSPVAPPPPSTPVPLSPPPGLVPPPGPAYADPGLAAYRPSTAVARVVVALLALTAAVSAVAFASDLAEYRLLTALVEDPASVSGTELMTSEARVGTLGIAQLLLYLGTAVAFVVWLHRVHANLEPLGARSLRFGSGWAIGGWFVPVLNLWRPKQVVDEAWRASEPEMSYATNAWRHVREPGTVVAWWSLFIIDTVVSGAAGTSAFSTEPEQLRTSAMRFVAVDVLDVTAAVAGIIVVASLTRRQQERARRFDVPDRGRVWRPYSAAAVTLLVSAGLGVAATLAFTPTFEASEVDLTTPADDGTVDGSDTLTVDELQPGACFDDPGDADHVVTVVAVPCSSPHDYEVIAAAPLSDGPLAAYPGEDDVLETGVALCEAEYRGITGRDIATSPHELFVIYPSADTWAGGDREVICAVGRVDGGKLEGNVRTGAG